MFAASHLLHQALSFFSEKDSGFVQISMIVSSELGERVSLRSELFLECCEISTIKSPKTRAKSGKWGKSLFIPFQDSTLK